MKGKNLLLLALFGLGAYLWYRSRKPKAATTPPAPVTTSTESQVSSMIANDSGVA